MTLPIRIKNLKIYLPDGDSKSFLIYGDLRPLLRVEYQVDALKEVRSRLKHLTLKPMPKSYYEEPAMGISSSKPEIFLSVIKAMNEVVQAKGQDLFSVEELKELENTVRNWKTPKRQKWKVGDIFSFTLEDGSFAYGQIVGSSPTVALFNLNSKDTKVLIPELLTKEIVTIIHVTSNKLNSSSWKVIGNDNLVIDKDSGPTGSDKLRIGHRSFSSNALNLIANYYFLRIWNWNNEQHIKDLILIK